MSEAMRVFDLTHQFEYYIYSSPFGTNPNLLFKTKSGITLIALVVTIVVLLILAGVTISLLLDENGIIKKIKRCKKRIWTSKGK